MGNPDPARPAVRIEPVSPGNDRATGEFLTGWVTDGPADAWGSTWPATPAATAPATIASRSRTELRVTLDDDIILWLTNDVARR
jgi:hypothetical protein